MQIYDFFHFYEGKKGKSVIWKVIFGTFMLLSMGLLLNSANLGDLRESHASDQEQAVPISPIDLTLFFSSTASIPL